MIRKVGGRGVVQREKNVERENGGGRKDGERERGEGVTK